MSYCAAVITVSDRAFAGVYEDKSGPAVAEMLKEAGYEVVYTAIVPDEKEKISEEVLTMFMPPVPTPGEQITLSAGQMIVQVAVGE